MSGTTTTLDAIGLPFREAIAFLAGKTNVTTAGWTDVWQEAHSRSFMVAGAATDSLVADFREAVTKALEQGTTLAEFRRDFDGIVARHGWDHVGTPGWRSRIIFETNLSTAYSAGRYVQATEPDTLAVYPYWQYVHSGSQHPRLNHLAWNGLVLRADDPWWSTHYPPNGWRCGCRVRPLSARGLARRSVAVGTAPPLDARPWADPRTGEVRQIPAGIDPGFAYNPGQAWGSGRPPELPADAVLRAPPGDWPPPVPAIAAATAPGATVPAELAALDRRLTDAGSGWVSTLTTAERRAFEAYKTEAGWSMNRRLRGDDTVPTFSRRIDAMRSALQRAALPFDLTLFRGVAGSFAAQLRALRPGAVLTEAGFLSASIDAATAASFARGGILIEIRAGAGTAGAAYIHHVPRLQKIQYEVAFAPGVRLRVVEVLPDRLILEVVW